MSDIYNIFEFLNLKFQVRIDFILKVDLFFFFSGHSASGLHYSYCVFIAKSPHTYNASRWHWQHVTTSSTQESRMLNTAHNLDCACGASLPSWQLAVFYKTLLLYDISFNSDFMKTFFFKWALWGGCIHCHIYNPLVVSIKLQLCVSNYIMKQKRTWPWGTKM